MGTLTREQEELLDLRDRVFDLEEELRVLKRAGEMLPLDWKLTRQEQRILIALARSSSGFASKEMLHARAMDRTEYDGGGYVSVIICKLRRKVKSRGVTIITRWGSGYELSFRSREVVLKAIIKVEGAA